MAAVVEVLDVRREVAVLLLDSADQLERTGRRRLARAHRRRARLLTEPAPSGR